MLRQLILICALGGLPQLGAAAETSATQSAPVSEAAQKTGKALECTLEQTAQQPQGPVWVVQTPATQGPVWVVMQDANAAKRVAEARS